MLVLKKVGKKGECASTNWQADKFIRGLEKVAGRSLHYRTLGRPKREKII
jgi:hypothetical protein